MSQRVLVIPAAGRGSRLGSDGPKVLAPVAGRPMLDWLLDLYLSRVDAITLVVQPGARDAVAAAVRRRSPHARIAVQQTPTGMLDAVRIGIDATPQPADRFWITWCDQIAVQDATLDRLAREEAPAALCFPTVVQTPPYIHFARGLDGRIAAVRQRREGDTLPATGESDMGLFSLSAEAGRDRLATFAADAAAASPGTGERNFLPFIPWLAAREVVHTFAATDPIEAVGINTPDDRARVEAFLARR